MSDSTSSPSGSSSQPAPQSSPLPRKKSRSIIERLVVWSGIAVLLLMAGFEAAAQRGYSATLSRLEYYGSRLHDDGPQLGGEASPPKNVASLATGWYSVTETQKNNKRSVRLKWPSLFKHYVLDINLNDDGNVVSFLTPVDDYVPPPTRQKVTDGKPTKVKIVQTEAARVESAVSDSASSETPTAQSIPAPSIAAGPVATTTENAASTATEKPPQATSANASDERPVENIRRGYGGPPRLLTREIIRQAFFITAQEKFGIATRDLAMGETQNEKTIASLPFAIDVDLYSEKMAKVEIRRTANNGIEGIRWEQTIEAPRSEMIETALARVHDWMKGEYVKLITDAGGTAKAGPVPDPSTDKTKALTDKLAFSLDPISQVSVLRRLHRQLHECGDACQTRAALARSYVLLGSLIEYDWGPRPKCFKARALIYADGAVRKWPEDADAWWTRAFVRALCGLHRPALSDIEHARTLSNPSSPTWGPAIEAFCQWDAVKLAESDVKGHALVPYLQFLAAEMAESDGMDRIEAAGRLWQRSPACYRAANIMIGQVPLGIRRQIVSTQRPIFEKSMSKLLSVVPQLPSTVKDLLSDKPKAGDIAEWRGKLVEGLLQADDQETPSCQLLGRMIDDIGFVQTFDLLYTERFAFGVDTSETLESHHALVRNHPFSGVLDAFATVGPGTPATPVNFGLLTKGQELGNGAQRLVMLMRTSRSGDWNGVLDRVQRQRDDVVDDLMLDFREPIPITMITRNLKLLSQLSPDSPRYISMVIWYDWESAEPHAEEWEKRFQDDPTVLSLLAQKYQEVRKYAAAERCVFRLIELRPDQSYDKVLADLYWKQEKFDLWKASMIKFMNLSANGLEQADAAKDVAYWHMSRKEWDDALPYAEFAASTSAAWGLFCAADCYEGLQQWDKAEEMLKACSNRYQSEQLSWYLWCLRTGRGDREAAKAFAMKTIAAQMDSVDIEPCRLRAAWYELEDEWELAAQTYDLIFQKHPHPRIGLAAALIQYRLGNTAERDRRLQLLTGDSHLWTENYLAQSLVRGLQQSPPKAPSEAECEWLSALSLEPSDVTTMQYFIGLSLSMFGEQERSLEWLRKAASAPIDVQYFRTLAGRELIQQKQNSPPRRATAIDSSVHESAELLRKGTVLEKSEHKYDEALGTYSQAVKAAPDWAPVRYPRANLLLQQRQFRAAADDFNHLIKLLPDVPDLYAKCGKSLEGAGDCRGAIEMYDAGLRIAPQDEILHNAYGWLLATCADASIRNPRQAIEHAEAPQSHRHEGSATKDALLAAAYAELGEFDKAVECQQRVIGREANTSMRDASLKQLELYREHKTFLRPEPPASGQ